MIYTFYSYKGGVGRSMALANVAEYYRRAGLCVVIVDWDLEAPGLEEFFWSEQGDLDLVRAQVGLMDLLLEYVRLHPSLGLPGAQALPALPPVNAEAAPMGEGRAMVVAEVLRTRLRPLVESLFPVRVDPPGEPGGGGVWLLPSGMRFGDSFPVYAAAVQTFDWRQFYAAYDGEQYFEWMREQLVTFADVILIDSRTGVTEMGGVCARQLADVVVSLCAPNHQNLEGVVQMTESFSRDEVLRVRGDRPLELVVVPTRLDRSESELLARFREEFSTSTSRFLPDAFRRVGSDFLRLFIPYIPLYAYRERLAIGDLRADVDLKDAYRRIALHLALLAPESGRLRLTLASEFRREFQDLLPRVAILGSGAEGGEWLRTALAERGVELWDDFPGLTAAGPPDSAPVEHLVLHLTADPSAWPRLRTEWNTARQLGVCVHPVLPPELKPRQLPHWLAGEPVYHGRDDLDLLVRRLGSPCRGIRVPFLVPPVAGHVRPREEPLAELVALLDQAGERPGESVVALIGLAGAGKTTLAQLACHDDRVVSAFPGGIYWVEQNGEGMVEAQLDRIFRARTGRDVGTLHTAEALSRVRLAIGDAPYLLVVDIPRDAAESSDFPVLGGRGCRLVIGRDERIVSDPGARVLCLGPMTPEESIALLYAEIDTDPADAASDPALGRLARELLHWPQALRLAAARLRDRQARGQSIGEAADELADVLRTDALGAREPVTMELRAALEHALEGLTSGDRRRLLLLRRRAERGEIPLTDLARSWGGSLPERRARAGRLAAAGLVEFDDSRDVLRVHTAVLHLLRSMEQNAITSKGAGWMLGAYRGVRRRGSAVAGVGVLVVLLAAALTASNLRWPGAPAPLLSRQDSLRALSSPGTDGAERGEILLALFAASSDFRGVDLSGIDLSHQKLQGIDFTNAILSGAKLVNAHLDEARLAGADLRHADLTQAQLVGADLSNARLDSADLNGANLRKATLANVDLARTTTSALTILQNGTPGPFRADEEVAVGSVDEASGRQVGVIWIGNYDPRTLAWEKPRLANAALQPIERNPESIGPGERYRVRGDLTLRAAVPPNDANYFRGVDALGWVPENSAVVVLESPVPVDRSQVSRQGRVQYWARVRVDSAAPFLNVYYRDVADAEVAERVAEALRTRGYSRRIVAHRPNARNTRTENVRFFHPEDRAAAAAAAQVAEQVLADLGVERPQLATDDRSGSGAAVTPGQLEIWLPPIRRARP